MTKPIFTPETIEAIGEEYKSSPSTQQIEMLSEKYKATKRQIYNALCKSGIKAGKSMGPSKKFYTQKEEIIGHYQETQSITKTAKAFGVTRDSLARNLKYWGVKRSKTREHFHLTLDEIEQIIDCYCRKWATMSIKNICDKFGIHQKTIYNLLKENNIKFRRAK